MISLELFQITSETSEIMILFVCCLHFILTSSVPLGFPSVFSCLCSEDSFGPPLPLASFLCVLAALRELFPGHLYVGNDLDLNVLLTLGSNSLSGA
jgi:hypothetical protein